MKRHNYWPNRYNQWVLAGKIAVETGAINPYNDTGKIHPIYRNTDGTINYSVVGQDYLRQLGLRITEL